MSVSRLSAGVSAMGAMSLALMGGLALACFAKVFGVVFLGEPRDPAIRCRPTPLAMTVGMALPAILCIVIGLLPGLFVPLTAGGVSAVAGITMGEFTTAVQTPLSHAGWLTVLATVLLAVGIGLALLRRALLRRVAGLPAPAVVTWGCGYARPSPRMQYTASSFAWSLILSFRSLLWTHRKIVMPAGPFAAHAELESHTPDMAEHDLFAPLLRAVSRAFRMIRTVSWTGVPAPDSRPLETGGRVGPLNVLTMGVLAALRRGRIHVCMGFLGLTLLVVFFIEALSSRGPATPSEAPAVGVLEGDAK
jgi:hypothetical protein